MPAPSSFEYAIVRVVPRVDRGELLNAGVILYCRALDYLAARIELDAGRLAALAPRIDVDEVRRALAVVPALCAGGRAAGPLGELPAGERFRWLVAPRSALVQASEVHCGLCTDPAATLEHLVATLVRWPAR